MPKRPQIELNREELLRAEIPTNHVLVRVIWRAEGATSKSGVVIGFCEDVNYAEDESFWSAELAEIRGEVVKTPKSLYFNPEDTAKSMDWETEMELIEGDKVWYSTLEAKNSVQVLCEGEIYKSIPYSDIYCYKREIWVDKWSVPQKKKTVVGVLNGFVLLKPCFLPVLSDLDHLSQETIDMTRGVISFIGEPPKAYLRDVYSHIEDLRIGDEVLFDRKTPLFMLERSKNLACFDGDNQFWCVQRRRIAMILNR
jgi:hypothetical protein